MASIRNDIMYFHHDRTGPLYAVTLDALRFLANKSNEDELTREQFEDILNVHREQIERIAVAQVNAGENFGVLVRREDLIEASR